jgi:predicted DNA-binding antitoxin AbrB/MazE fold protein
MSKRIEAVYENGVLRPLEPLLLRDHQHVSILVQDDAGSPAAEDWLDTVRQALSKIQGSMTSDFIAERRE